MTINKNIYLNASEHLLALNFPDAIALRNFSYRNGYKFCSMIGGPESIRDIKQSVILNPDAYEFPLVESIFSLEKIFNAFDKNLFSRFLNLHDAKVFIHIDNSNSLELLKNIGSLIVPNFIKSSNIIFTLNITNLLTTLPNLTCQNSVFERNLASIIFPLIDKITKRGFLYSVSGALNPKQVSCLLNLPLKPSFLKTSLFTIPTNDLTDIQMQDVILELKETEKILFRVFDLFSDLKYCNMNTTTYIDHNITVK